MDRLVAKFIADKQMAGLSPATIRWYQSKLNDYAMFVLSQNDIMDPLLLAAYINGLRCSDKTKAGHVRAIRSFHGWALDHGLPDITRKFRPRFQEKPQRPIMPRRIIEKIIYGINKQCFINIRNRLFFLFAYHTGCRRAEILNLRRCDIDVDAQIASVVGKGNKWRNVPLSTELCCELIEYLPRVHGSYLFVAADRAGLPSKKDRPIEGGRITNAWADLQRENGIHTPWRLHDLRHACATHLIDAGVSLYSVQNLLGHADAQMTRHYAKMSQARLKFEIGSVFG